MSSVGRGPGLAQPVIVVYDNDDGGKAVRNVLKETFRVKCSGAEPFVHVFKNVYAVPTPFGPDSAPSKIEDLFDDAIKATTIDGKAFNSANVIDKEKEYGKKVFAHKVVTPKATTIDFSGFRPLLTNIAAAITHHRSIVVPPTGR